MSGMRRSSSLFRTISQAQQWPELRSGCSSIAAISINAQVQPHTRERRCLYRPQSIHQRLDRQFSTSTQHFKDKSSKKARETTKDQAAGEDPFDFSALETSINVALDRLKNDLSKLRSGGRFNHETIENLKVQPDKSSQSMVKLVDVAQVIPKGRTIHIIVGERDHLKPVSSAIQSSNLSLTPQPDPTGSNPLLLEIKIPPPTAESRQMAVKEAVKLGEKASTVVRDARAKQHKTHRAMQLAKSARGDDLTKAGKQMERVVEKAQQDVKKIIDNAKKVLETV